MTAEQQAPDTLPADFFDKPQSTTTPAAPPPDTLPADFFDKPQKTPPKETLKSTPAANPSDNSFIEQYKQNSILRVAYDLLGAASRDPETIQRAKETAAQLWQGLSSEPGRIKNEFLAFWNQAQQGHFQGDPAAAIPHLLRSVPFLGPLSEQIAQKIAAGQYAGAAGQFAAGAIEPTLIPKIAGGVTDVAANARDIPAMAAGGARGAWEGFTGPGSFKMRVGGVPVEVPAPRGFTRAAGGGLLGYKLGGTPGAIIGTAAGAAYPFVRGAYRGAVSALEEARAARALAEFEAQARMFDQFHRAAQGPPDRLYIPPERQISQQGETIITPAPADTSSVTAVPGEYAQREPLPPSRQLPPGREIREMPAAEDTSYVRAVPGEYPAVTEAIERAPIVNEPPIAAPAVTAEVSASAADLPEFTLDDFAKGLAKKPFAKLSAKDQASVQAAYDRFQQSKSEPPPDTMSAAEAQARFEAEKAKPPAEEQPTFEEAGREKKASLYADWLIRKQVPLTWLESATPDTWRLVQGELAKENPGATINLPSEQTAAAILDKVRAAQEETPPTAKPAGEPTPVPAEKPADAPISENVDRMLAAIPNVKYELVKNFSPMEWQVIEELADLPPQSAATRQALLDRLERRPAPKKPPASETGESAHRGAGTRKPARD